MVATSANTGLFTGSPSAYGCYTASPNNVSVSGGSLNLTVRREDAPITCRPMGGTAFSTHYTAGQVATSGLFSQTYGRFAIRAAFPAVTVAGLHAGLWMWPQHTGPAGEIDIAEWYSEYPTMVMPTLHYDFDESTVDYATDTNIATSWSCNLSDAAGAFHEYAVQWTPSTFTFTYDGTTCITDHLDPSGPSPFDQPYFLALTQALGGGTNAFTPGGTPVPATTRIDWVHGWK